LAADDERDLSLEQLPPLRLPWVDVLGHVTARSGLYLRQKILAIS
jgi:hypothetical protein